MMHFLLLGILLGGAAGVAPGPLLALVISESLQYGVRSGVKVALAPLISDLPIIMLSLIIVSRLSGLQQGLGLIAIAGGIFMLFCGYQAICTKAVELSLLHEPSRSLRKGVVANMLNPHPYLFWIGVGAPTMDKALGVGILALVMFIAGFYFALVGSKVVLSIVVGKSRMFLAGKVYLTIVRALGLLLCVFAFLLFRDGVRLLGLL